VWLNEEKIVEYKAAIAGPYPSLHDAFSVADGLK